mmetsp:Transcript_86334/g.166189  ORF Transcript_86334/g.166189 Transcript_86334/m.166189 type:complete len:139 (-) Transcript_86334:229-645(-)
MLSTPYTPQAAQTSMSNAPRNSSLSARARKHTASFVRFTGTHHLGWSQQWWPMILSLLKLVGVLQPQSESAHGGFIVLPKQSKPAAERLQEVSVICEDGKRIGKNKWSRSFHSYEADLCFASLFVFVFNWTEDELLSN